MSLLDSLKGLSKRTAPGNSELADKLEIVLSVVNGETFVSGLHWVKLNKLHNYMAEARKLAKQPAMAGMAIVAIRERNLRDDYIVAQAGFAPERAGASKNRYSMAATVAGALGDNFVALLTLEAARNRYVVVACSDGNILTTGDLVVQGREEAETAFNRALSRINLGRRNTEARHGDASELKLYAPADFEIEGAKERDLAELLAKENLRSEYKLQHLALWGLSPREVRRYALYGGACLALLCVGDYGWQWAYPLVQEKFFPKKVSVSDAKQQAGLSGKQSAQPPKPLPHPWLTRAPVQLLVRECAAQLIKLPIEIEGFDLAAAECEQGTINATYTRPEDSFGSLDKFRAAVHRLFNIEPEPQTQNDGNTVLIHANFNMPHFHITDSKPPDANTAYWNLVSYFQEQVGSVKVNKEDPPKASGDAQPGGSNAAAAANTPLQDWNTYHFTVDNATMPPEVTLQGLTMETVRINSISMIRNVNGTEAGYSIDGELYVQ